MKHILILISFIVFSLGISAQPINIRVVANTSQYIDISLGQFNGDLGLLSNVVFTLKWDETDPIVFGDPEPVTYLTALDASGPVLSDNGFNYQIFAGFGFVPTQLEDSTMIRIPKTGFGDIELTNDPFITNILNNGEFYVSINGVDVTGEILDPVDINTTIIEHIEMVYDPNRRELMTKRNGAYYNLLGKRIEVNNVNELKKKKK